MASFFAAAPGQDNPHKAPLYWSVYEYCYTFDGAIPESEWLANINWVDENLKPFGYEMICIDGWGDDNQYNEHGYRMKHAAEWTHDYAWWSNELQSRGMTLGMYYNPLWINRNAAATGTMIQGTDIPLSSLIDESEDALWFTWVQVDRPGAEAYVKGYIQFYADMGIKYLRVDFLSWYESGMDKGTRVGPARPLEHYETALRWMREACDANGMFLSLVMPNLYNEAATEARYGHMVRINEDAGYGTWERFSELDRGTRFPGWSQYHNAFDGYTYWSHVAGRNRIILDGDFIRINTMANDVEKKTVISLHLMAGGPLSVADQYSTIEQDLWFYQNTEMLALNQDRFVGKPLSNDPAEPSSQIWTGQMSNGDWIIGLFNREDQIEKRRLDFSSLGIEGPVRVRDLWAHSDLGSMDAIDAYLPPHGCLVYRITPGTGALQPQTIDFEGIANVENTALTPRVAVAATASSGLPVDLEVIYGPAELQGDTLIFTGGSGEILLTAGQPGNEEYGSAIPVPVVFFATDPVQPFEKLYILGDATPVGWNIGRPAEMTQNKANPYLWEWEGELSAGEFKFPTFTGDWCDGLWINASQPDQPLLTAAYAVTRGCEGPDYKWRVREEDAGKYRIVVDVEEQSVQIIPNHEPRFENIYILGDATPVGWNIASPIPLERDEANPFLFSTEVPLTAGEFKFPTFTGDWCDGDWINASRVNQSLDATEFIITHGCDGPDNKWVIQAVESGTYRITIDLEHGSILIEPAGGVNAPGRRSIGFTTFPNPVSGTLHITFPGETEARVSLYTLTGNLLYREKVHGTHTGIELDDLTDPGLILLEISTRQSREMRRIVVQ